jgi:NTE family protein
MWLIVSRRRRWIRLDGPAVAAAEVRDAGLMVPAAGKQDPGEARDPRDPRDPRDLGGSSGPGLTNRPASRPDAPHGAPGGRPVAFVLGGGGLLGASEVGMLAALFEAGIRPDLVVGASVGAINGAVVAAAPTVEAVARLTDLWSRLGTSQVFAGGPARQLATVVQHGHLHSNAPLRRMLRTHLPVTDFAELAVPFQCVAASIERATARWFTSGPLIDAVLASCAVPALLPPVSIDGEHYVDGGIVDSTPVGRAVALGARTVYVLHVGRIERPLTAPRWPWEAGLVAFEIARRRGFTDAMAALPDGVAVHVLPAGDSSTPIAAFRYRSTFGLNRRIELAWKATTEYLLARVPAGARAGARTGTGTGTGTAAAGAGAGGGAGAGAAAGAGIATGAGTGGSSDGGAVSGPPVMSRVAYPVAHPVVPSATPPAGASG